MTSFDENIIGWTHPTKLATKLSKCVYKYFINVIKITNLIIYYKNNADAKLSSETKTLHWLVNLQAINRAQLN